ncbi:glycosyltransferase [Paucihalobacter ruber]|uniref:Glycosyltransferase n=1 Tax=Paucihalobacter ruber TaxID=2567861 RepID=A0A506PHP5_9FLAO|nr:glycosyltransferase [Paucihalobacter ruber]TPV33366.1 glycosyltransferase [Paucihalobacter ruber]
MKLGIFMYSLSGGGAERQFIYIVSYCIKHDIDVCFILMNSTIKYDLPEDVKIYYLEKSNFNESGILKAAKIPLLAYKYSRLIKKLKVTHSISLLSRPNFINIIARTFTNYRFKLIINELAYPSLEYSYKNFQSTFNKLMIRFFFKKADLIICNSNGNQMDLINNFKVPANKTAVVNNPIDLDKIHNIAAIKGFFLKNHFNMITIGRLDRGKNHSLLINALSKLNNPKLKLYIFGEGVLRDELEALIDKLKLQNQVFLMGFDSNPFKYLKGADLFVFGSNHEGFPNVVLEAMASGLPILTTNCKSGPSEIMNLVEKKEDLMITDYGILVPVMNVELMSKGMSYFIENINYLNTSKINVLERVKIYEKDRILEKYIQTIKSVN